jgi:predicted metal-dependent peptidase
MTTKQAEFRETASRQMERQHLLEALESGELVRLLAEADAGKLDPRELEAAMEQYERKHWLRRLFAALLGKRV